MLPVQYIHTDTITALLKHTLQTALLAREKRKKNTEQWMPVLLQRLQELYLLDPAKFSTLTGILEKEVKEGTARKVDSCARAVLWLAR